MIDYFSRTSRTNLSSPSGMTLIEIMIVVGMLIVLFIIVMSYMGRGSMQKARDAERKDDLRKIKIAYEEYYNDNGCYPPSDTLLNCNSSSTELGPYLSQIPCDPLTGEPYIYVPHPSTGDRCSGYRVYAPLEWTGDPVIEELNCTGGCGILEEHLTYNGINRWEVEDYTYGISEGVPLSYSEGEPGLTSGYCCEVVGDDCQVWQWSVDSPGCSGFGPYARLQECYDGGGGCVAP